MGDKYIIELGEKERAYKTVDSDGWPMIMLLTPTPYTEPDMEQVRKEAYDKGYENGFIAGHLKAEKSGQSFYEDGYKRGLADAWEAARKIAKLNTDKQKGLFGCFGIYFIAHEYSASEAIEKIRQHEQEKEEQITKGDVVLIKSAPEVEILVTYADEEYVSGIALTEVDDNCEIGDQYTNIRISNVENTGKHYDIVSVLQKMKEE